MLGRALASGGGGEGVLSLISELNEHDLAAAESDPDDYTASTDSNMSSCSESGRQ